MKDIDILLEDAGYKTPSKLSSYALLEKAGQDFADTAAAAARNHALRHLRQVISSLVKKDLSFSDIEDASQMVLSGAVDASIEHSDAYRELVQEHLAATARGLEENWNGAELE